jgi:hypothetical protein
MHGYVLNSCSGNMHNEIGLAECISSNVAAGDALNESVVVAALFNSVGDDTRRQRGSRTFSFIAAVVRRSG